LLLVLTVTALAYALLAGLRTVMDYDLGWQLATGRWVAQHRQVFSTDVFSYTARGRPWIYPVGSGLIFYGVYLVGKYALLSWLGAAACVATVALLLWRRSAIAAALAILAIPMIALRTPPRADMFTVVLFAAFLSLLWRQHESGCAPDPSKPKPGLLGTPARLWLLPLLMLLWVNLHLGFVAGLALVAAYAVLEALEMLWPDRRQAAAARLRRACPWLAATFAATLVNPWKWGIYGALLRQEATTAAHSQRITEWEPTRLNWTTISMNLSPRSPDGAVYLLLLVAAVAVLIALWRRKPGAALLLCGSSWLAVRHIRFQALFAEVVVVVGSAMLLSVLGGTREKLRRARPVWLTAVALAYLMVGLACLRSADLVSNRAYLGGTNLSSFGAGLSWWFPEDASAFIERENLPSQIFNSYNEGGYLVWRLGPKYPDYIDGRALPFGPELFERNRALLATPPDSPEWQHEAEKYGIHAIIVPLSRYSGVELFPVLRQFCASEAWRPVYLDEVSGVFVRRTPQTETLIQKFGIDCAKAPLPHSAPQGDGSPAFNQWANAAAILYVLGRDPEAFVATERALDIFEGSAYVHYLRGKLFEQARDLPAAEQEYRRSASQEVNGSTWSSLGAIYRREGRLADAIAAWRRAADLLRSPDSELLALGYAELEGHEPRAALRAFDRAASQPARQSDIAFQIELARGRARACRDLGDADRAIIFQEEAVRLAPEQAVDWLDLAELYDRGHRSEDAQRARQQAAILMFSQSRPDR
jgi:Flp pilus assembly protein TadD